MDDNHGHPEEQMEDIAQYDNQQPYPYYVKKPESVVDDIADLNKREDSANSTDDELQINKQPTVHIISNDKVIDDDCESSLTFDTLPPEIILQICTYLDARTVIRNLSKVCKYLFYLINDNRTWKLRIGKKWPKKYPAIPVNDNCFNWKEACIQREDHYRQWSNPTQTTDRYTIREGLFASVDTVHLMNNGSLLASGSRDRYINLYDLSKLQVDDPSTIKSSVVASKLNAHKGWIWSSDSIDNTLVTGSWDAYVKFWDMNAELEEKQKVKINSAALCLNYEEDLLTVGSYDKRVYWIDPRESRIVAKHRYHKQPVLCMAVDENYVITGSEDKTIVVFDKRAGSVYKTVQLDHFPMSMSYGSDQLWIGDKVGQIHLYDATDADFNLVETYDVGHKTKVTGITHSLGSIITCSTDKTIRVLEPNLNPSVICTLSEPNSQLAQISFEPDAGILAAACSDSSINVWLPRPYHL